MSKKNNKYTFWGTKSRGRDKILLLEQEMQQLYINKNYNLWMDKFEWEGLDEENAAQQKEYIMRKFWGVGTIACRPIDNTDLLAFAPYTVNTYNMYDHPEVITLVNTRGVSDRIIPTTTQVVGKDVVIGWCQPNKKSIYSIVKTYIDRMVQVDMILNTNLQLQKLPWLIAANENDEDALKDVVDRILHNEVVVFTSIEELQRIQTLTTQTPYLVDKLLSYRQSLERELMTFLGIDNIGSSSDLTQTHINSDQTNANNDEINAYASSIEEGIKTFINDINRVFGRKISIKCKANKVASVHKTDMNGGNENDE